LADTRRRRLAGLDFRAASHLSSSASLSSVSRFDGRPDIALTPARGASGYTGLDPRKDPFQLTSARSVASASRHKLTSNALVVRGHARDYDAGRKAATRAGANSEVDDFHLPAFPLSIHREMVGASGRPRGVRFQTDTLLNHGASGTVHGRPDPTSNSRPRCYLSPR
jgi:hypothetical protein